MQMNSVDVNALATGNGMTFDWGVGGKRDAAAWMEPQDGFLAIALRAGGQACEPASPNDPTHL